jgi:tetratricopeptide (TPR) repeat protein
MKPYFVPTEITLKEVPDSSFKELAGEDLTFHDANGETWTAPVGTLTDGATVPRMALGVTDGRFQREFLKAAVVHDAYCQQENHDRCPQFHSRPWPKVHEMFYAACLAGGTPELKARVMFAAVSWFGPRWNDPDSEGRQVDAGLAMMGFAGARQWIKDARPDIAAIAADTRQREQEIAGIAAAQFEALAAIDAHDPEKAEASLRAADTAIAAGLAKSPDDLMYLNLLGYQHKNWAILRPQARKQELEQANRLFAKVNRRDPRDPSALNGLGSVAVLRNELDLAERYVRQALALNPDYDAAWHDLRLIYQLKAWKQKQ